MLTLLSGCFSSHESPDAPADAHVAPDSRDTSSCRSGLDGCDGTDDDCDGLLDEDPACMLPGATSSCEAGACAISACDADRLDCNGLPADGCETDLLTDVLHCGGCGRACDANALCEAGSCVEDPIVDVEPQLQFTVVQLASGRLVAWGTGIPLPSGESVDSTTPIVLDGVPRADLMASTGTAIFVISDDRLYGWGANDGAELAQGFMSEPGALLPLTEIALPTTNPLTLLAAGGSRWIAVADSREDIYYWGSLKADGTIDAEGVRPRRRDFRVDARPGLVDLLVMGDSFAARFDRATGLKFWGYFRNDVATSVGGAEGSWMPVAGTTLPSYDADCSASHCCSNEWAGDWFGITCWGRQDHGALGQPEGAASSYVARPVSGLEANERFLDIATSDSRATCVLRADASLWCWGSAEGNGLGEVEDAWTARPVSDAPPGLTGLRSGANICAIVGSSRLLCWGDNRFGAIGPSSTDAIVRRPAAVDFGRR